MQILVIGNTSGLEELKLKFGPNHNYLLCEPGNDNTELIKGAEVIFDFYPDKNSIRKQYSDFSNPVFLNTAFISLSELIEFSTDSHQDSFIGFCGLHTFVNRSVLEVTVSSIKSKECLKQICLQLGTDFVAVEDHVGLVTPRVICMIINEAYFTLEEGTATLKDIDLAMKLGTNYPFGPFEWAQRIGISEVVKLLDAVHYATNDERYKVCDLLRSEMNS